MLFWLLEFAILLVLDVRGWRWIGDVWWEKGRCVPRGGGGGIWDELLVGVMCLGLNSCVIVW